MKHQQAGAQLLNNAWLRLYHLPVQILFDELVTSFGDRNLAIESYEEIKDTYSIEVMYASQVCGDSKVQTLKLTANVISSYI